MPAFPRPSLRSVRAGLALAAALSCLTGLGGCSSTPAPVAASPDVRAAATGLEVRWWVVDNAPALVPLRLSPNAMRRLQAKDVPTATVAPPTWREVLAPFADRPVPVPDDVRDRWLNNGLRLYSIPVKDLPDLRARLRLVGPVQDRWFGHTPVWTEAVRGPALMPVDTVHLDTGLLRIEGGTMRLLTRAWIVPGSARAPELVGPPAPAGRGRAEPAAPGEAPIPAVLQLELLPQHHVPPVRSDEFTIEPTKPVPPEEQGLAFDRLTLRTTLGGDDALVIVPDGPPSAANDDPAASDVGVGPPPPRGLTFGEALLTDKPARGAAGSLVFVVLVPRVPASYNLLAP